jgi:hypothetical protein
MTNLILLGKQIIPKFHQEKIMANCHPVSADRSVLRIGRLNNLFHTRGSIFVPPWNMLFAPRIIPFELSLQQILTCG